MGPLCLAVGHELMWMVIKLQPPNDDTILWRKILIHSMTRGLSPEWNFLLNRGRKPEIIYTLM